MKQLVVDAGPLIGLFYARDPLHLECVAGFEQLNAAKALVLTPIPIIFEVYYRDFSAFKALEFWVPNSD